MTANGTDALQYPGELLPDPSVLGTITAKCDTSSTLSESMTSNLLSNVGH